MSSPTRVLVFAGVIASIAAGGLHLREAEAKPGKKIRRSCESAFVVEIRGKRIKLDRFNVESFEPAIPDFTAPFRFTSSGSCGKLVPNRCRARASAVALRCMKAMGRYAQQSQRWSGEAMDSTTNPNGSGPPPEPDPIESIECPRSGGGALVHQPFAFAGNNLSGYTKRYVCAVVNGWLDQHEPGKTEATHVAYTVHGQCRGKKGCSCGKATRVASLGAICKRVRNATSDLVKANMRIRAVAYRQLQLARGSDPMLCRQACMREAKCLSWDVSPRSRNPMICKLYDRYHPLKTGQGTAGMK